MDFPLTHETLQAIQPALLEAHLVRHGWTRTGLRRPAATMWTWVDPDTEQRYQLLAPEDASFDDYTNRLADALRVLAAAHDKRPAVLLADLLTGPADVLRFASQAPIRSDGSIPAIHGLKFFKGIEDTLKASAKAQRERRSYYGNLYWDRAKAFLQSARLGQTEVGSYVVTVLSSVPGGAIEMDEETGQLTVPGSPRMERFIVETLMRALQAARSAVDEFTSGGDVSAFQDAVSDGVSSDLCSGLAGLTEGSGGAGVKVSVQWSPLLDVPRDTPSEVDFDAEDVHPLEVGAETLRSVKVETDAQVSGWVETLHREEDQPGPGVITLVVDEGPIPRGQKARIDLSATDYTKALRAHGASRHITVSGDLVQESGRNWLHNARIVEPGREDNDWQLDI